MLAMQMVVNSAIHVFQVIIQRVTYALQIPLALALTAPRTPRILDVRQRIQRGVWHVIPVFI